MDSGKCLAHGGGANQDMAGAVVAGKTTDSENHGFVLLSLAECC